MTSVIILGAPLLLLLYYVVVYFRLGTDSTPQVMVPKYAPPAGLSPAYLRFIWRGVADARTVAAICASLSSRGRISLHKNAGKYTVRRLYSQPTPLSDLPAEENTVLDFFFSNFYEETTFDPATQSQGCASVILGKLMKSAGSRYVHAHSGYVAIGVLGSCLASGTLLLAKPGPMRLLDSTIAAGLIAALALFGPLIAKAVEPLLRDIRQGTWRFMRIFLALLLMSFVLMWFVIIGAGLHADYSWNVVNAIFVMALLNAVAQPFLRRDTEAGKKLKQEIEGFRAFLLAVEQDQLDRMNKANEQIKFAGHVAYAVALEVKEAWGEYLCNAFSQI